MPNKPPTPCTVPGCPGKAASGRCERCRGRANRDGTIGAGTTDERGYDRLWRSVRLHYLIRHPRCALCPRAATVADHYPVSRRLLVARGVAEPDADERLRPLCARCHNRETSKRQPGGWHRT